MPRLFICVQIPDSVRRELWQVRSDLARCGADVRWVSSENYHVTIKFLGDVEESLVGEAGVGIERSAAAFTRFSVRVQGVGAFPRVDSPRVVWAGIEKGAEDLARLAEDVEKELTRAGLPEEERDFHPHVTMGRVRGRRRVDALAAAIRDVQDRSFGQLEVGGLTLMESTLTPSGPRYSPLRTATL